MVSSYPFEIHITVANVQRDRFVAACDALGIKPVLLELQSRTNGVLSDAMTSSKMMGEYHEAVARAGYLATVLSKVYDLDMVRIKIETVPWHPMAQDPSARGAHQYMECHLQLPLTKEFIATRWSELTEACANDLQLHLSRNVLKNGVQPGTVIHMATFRDYKLTPDNFSTCVEYARYELERRFGIVAQKTEIEFAVLDTNAGHDGEWMT